MKAEHRLGLRASEIPAFAAELAKAVGVAGVERSGYAWTGEQQKFLAALAEGPEGQCRQERGDSGALSGCFGCRAGAGDQQCARQRGQDGFCCAEPANPLPSDQLGDFKALVADLNAGKVDWLVILNANPIYDAPADLNFADAFNKANIVAHLGSHVDETGQISHWHITCRRIIWSRGRMRAPTTARCSIVQPMIDPLYGGKTAHDVLQSLLDEPMLSAYEAVRETWKRSPIQAATSRRAGARRCMTAGLTDTAYDRTGKGRVDAAFHGTVPAPTPKDSHRDHLPARSECL